MSSVQNERLTGYLGIVDRLIAALDTPAARSKALDTLSTLTHHHQRSGSHTSTASLDPRWQLAKHAAALVSLLADSAHEPEWREGALCILSHSLETALHPEHLDEKPASLKEIQSWGMSRLIDVVLKEVLHSPRSTRVTHYHALELLSLCSCTAQVKGNKSAINLLVAGLRSADLTARGICAGALVHSFFTASDDSLDYNPSLLRSVIMGIPDRLNTRLESYDPTLCETYITRHLVGGLANNLAEPKIIVNGDMVALGNLAAPLVVNAEHVIVLRLGVWMDQLREAGMSRQLHVEDEWQLLERMGDALLRTGNDADRDQAFILLIKLCMSVENPPAAVEAVGRRAISHNPSIAYYHFAASRIRIRREALRACKTGLACSITTPFVRATLLAKAVQYAFEEALHVLHGAITGSSQYRESLTLMKSALDDAKTFIAETPPDNKYMVRILHFYLVLNVTMRGPELSTDLHELGVCNCPGSVSV